MATNFSSCASVTTSQHTKKWTYAYIQQFFSFSFFTFFSLVSLNLSLLQLIEKSLEIDFRGICVMCRFLSCAIKKHIQNLASLQELLKKFLIRGFKEVDKKKWKLKRNIGRTILRLLNFLLFFFSFILLCISTADANSIVHGSQLVYFFQCHAKSMIQRIIVFYKYNKHLIDSFAYNLSFIVHEKDFISFVFYAYNNSNL